MEPNRYDIIFIPMSAYFVSKQALVDILKINYESGQHITAFPSLNLFYQSIVEQNSFFLNLSHKLIFF